LAVTKSTKIDWTCLEFKYVVHIFATPKLQTFQISSSKVTFACGSKVMDIYRLKLLFTSCCSIIHNLLNNFYWQMENESTALFCIKFAQNQPKYWHDVSTSLLSKCFVKIQKETYKWTSEKRQNQKLEGKFEILKKMNTNFLQKIQLSFLFGSFVQITPRPGSDWQCWILNADVINSLENDNQPLNLHP
jgi:hypothetical protein